MATFSREVTLEDYLSKTVNNTQPPTYPQRSHWLLQQPQQQQPSSKGGFFCAPPQSIAMAGIGLCKRSVTGDGSKKKVERKEKRMIKNRESATRSRARKQAYTRQLESKISELEKENEELKMFKESEIRHTVPHKAPEPVLTLRRTFSALF